MAYSDTTFYLDKDRDFLEKELHTKLEVLSGYIAIHILNTWRRTPTHYDANSPYLHDHDIITILQFIDRYPVEKFASAYQNVFKEYIREIIDCGGWIQMINHWDEDPRFKDEREIRKDSNGWLEFESDKQLEDYKQDKRLITALKMAKDGEV